MRIHVVMDSLLVLKHIRPKKSLKVFYGFYKFNMAFWHSYGNVLIV